MEEGLPSLPYNVLYGISLHLSPKDLVLGLSLTSSYFARTILQDSDSLWRNICKIHWGNERLCQHYTTLYNTRYIKSESNIKRRRMEDNSTENFPHPCFWLNVFKSESIADKNWETGKLVKKVMVNSGQRKTFSERKERAKWERRPLWGWGCSYAHLQAFDVSPHFIVTFCNKRRSMQKRVVVFSSQGPPFEKLRSFYPFQTGLNELPLFGEFLKISIVSSKPDEAVVLILDGAVASLWLLQGLDDPKNKSNKGTYFLSVDYFRLILT